MKPLQRLPNASEINHISEGLPQVMSSGTVQRHAVESFLSRELIRLFPPRSQLQKEGHLPAAAFLLLCGG